MAGIDGAAVKLLRERDGQSAKDFAARVEISPSYLSEIESGIKHCRRNPALIKRIAEALNVPISMIEERVAS